MPALAASYHRPIKVYTHDGDDEVDRSLLYGRRVRKDSTLPVAYGSVDEAQAAIGFARAHVAAGSELDAPSGSFTTCTRAWPSWRGNHQPVQAGTWRQSDDARWCRGSNTRSTRSVRASIPNEFVIPGDNPSRRSSMLPVTVVRHEAPRSMQSTPVVVSRTQPLSTCSGRCALAAGSTVPHAYVHD